MQNQEILQVLKSFSKKEIYRFQCFLSSPYFNTNKAIVALFNELKKCYPKFKSKKLDRKYLYSRIYTNDTYNDSTIRNLFFRFGELVEKFLIIESVSVNQSYLDSCILHEYNMRKQKEMFLKRLRDMEARMKDRGEMDMDYFHGKFLIEIEKFNFKQLHEFKTKRNEINYKMKCIDRASIYMSINYIREMMSFYLNQGIIINKNNFKEYKSIIAELIESVNIEKMTKLLRNKDEHYFVLELYYHLWECYSKFEEVKYYYAYKDNFNKVIKKLGRDEIAFHFSKLIGYCIYKSGVAEFAKAFKKELLEVYHVFLENEYYKDKKIDHLQHDLYRNILQLALDMGDMNFTKNFIDKYSKKVEFQLREKMYSYGYAFYYYYAGNYKKSLEYLNDILTDNFYFRYDARHLQIAVNFSSGNYQEVYRLIQEYRVSINDIDLMNESSKQKHYNYLNLIGKLLSFLYGNDKIDPYYIKNKIMTSDKIVQKYWLEEQCDKILSKKIARVGSVKSKMIKVS